MITKLSTFRRAPFGGRTSGTLTPKVEEYGGFKLSKGFKQDLIRQEMIKDLQEMYNPGVNQVLSQRMPTKSSDARQVTEDSNEDIEEVGEFSQYLSNKMPSLSPRRRSVETSIL